MLMLALKPGIWMEEGITSVSKGGITFFVGERPSPEERRETRVFFPLATRPDTLRLAGDLRGDRGGGDCGRAEVVGCKGAAGRAAVVEAAGAGVGGSSASIISTCHDRFSSRNLRCSACKTSI